MRVGGLILLAFAMGCDPDPGTGDDTGGGGDADTDADADSDADADTDADSDTDADADADADADSDADADADADPAATDTPISADFTDASVFDLVHHHELQDLASLASIDALMVHHLGADDRPVHEFAV